MDSGHWGSGCIGCQLNRGGVYGDGDGDGVRSGRLVSGVSMEFFMKE